MVKALVIPSGDCEFNFGTDMRKIFQYFSYYKITQLNYHLFGYGNKKPNIFEKHGFGRYSKINNVSTYTQYTRELYGIFTHNYN